MAKDTKKTAARKTPAGKTAVKKVKKAATPPAARDAAAPARDAGSKILKVAPQRPSSRAVARASGAEPYRVRLLDYLVKGGAVAEIGVWRGDFAAVLLEKLQPSALHLIDPWQFQPKFPKRMYGGLSVRDQAGMDRLHTSVVKRFANRPEVHIHRQLSVDGLQALPDASLDVCFVDGDHSFDVVLQDFVLAHRKVKSGGYICGDDWGWKDEQGRTSVRDAILAYLQMNPVDFVHIRNGQILIRRP